MQFQWNMQAHVALAVVLLVYSIHHQHYTLDPLTDTTSQQQVPLDTDDGQLSLLFSSYAGLATRPFQNQASS